MKVFYLTDKGKYTEDAKKAAYGEATEYKAPRFKAQHNGHEMIFTEQEIGLPKKPKKNG